MIPDYFQKYFYIWKTADGTYGVDEEEEGGGDSSLLGIGGARRLQEANTTVTVNLTLNSSNTLIVFEDELAEERALANEAVQDQLDAIGYGSISVVENLGTAYCLLFSFMMYILTYALSRLICLSCCGVGEEFFREWHR